MKIILHIGMGKTGTSAIQKALSENDATLKQESVRYLGMWFSLVDQRFEGPLGLRQFIQLTPPDMRKYARQYVRKLKQVSARQNCSTFILSNETLFLYGPQMRPFIDELSSLVDVQLVLFMRNVYSWLPSAYTQWCIRHKGMTGENKGFQVEGSRLIKWYENFIFWHQAYSDRLAVLKMEEGKDVVAEFGALINVKLNINKESGFYRREGPAITLLRSIFNASYNEPMRPEVFNEILYGFEKFSDKELQHYMDLSFDFDQIDDIILEHKPTLDRVEKLAQIDLTSNLKQKSKKPSFEDIRDDLLYHLALVTVQQAQEIDKLKKAFASIN